MITKVNPTIPIVDQEGRPNRQLQDFLLQVSSLGIIVGTGSPENVVEALQTQLYMDDAGLTGVVLYIKQSADVAGDRSQGWILV